MAPGLRVLITRPAAQGARLDALLRLRDADPVSLPLFEIRPAGDETAHRRRLDEARTWTGWLFTSANAARAATGLDAGTWPTLYAIGEATARTLAQSGRPGARFSTAGSSSEDLLAHPDFQRVGGQRFLVCTGEAGRDRLVTGMRGRGAEVERLELYRRVPIEHSPEVVRAAADACDAIICTSGDSLERLCALLPEDLQSAMRARLLVVPSPRVLELARRLGFAEVRAPQRTSDESLVECLFQPA